MCNQGQIKARCCFHAWAGVLGEIVEWSMGRQILSGKGGTHYKQGKEHMEWPAMSVYMVGALFIMVGSYCGTRCRMGE